METALIVPEKQEVSITQDQKSLIKSTICKDATDAEMQLFFYDCKRRGVHPLDKLIHFTKRSGKYTPITSIDFMRQRAQATDKYAGEDEPVYDSEDGQHPEWCKYSVYRLVQGQRCKWTATARWNEYYPGDQLGFMWKKMPYLMLAKCAEALALRKAFPAELQGLYVKEEMDQAGPVMQAKPEDGLKDTKAGSPPPAANVPDHPASQDAPAPFVWRIGADHKGKPVTDIPDKYLEWAKTNMKLQDHADAARMELDRRAAQESFAEEGAE